MGAKQSSPAPNGRTRAYSGSDLPSTTASSNGSSRSVAASSGSRQGSGSGAATGSSTLASGRMHLVAQPAGGPRSMASGSRNQSLNIPNSGGTYSSSQEESEGSTPEESTGERPGGQPAPRLLIGSLPAHLSPHLFGGFKCPVCSKFVSSDEMDLHLVMCLTKPRVTYNGESSRGFGRCCLRRLEDVLSKDTGECAICLEELQQGDTIARLPCLCIYHKGFSCHFCKWNNLFK
ncbi:E3 ubiquitin-protein ligase znrf2-like isoform X2 [Carcharodon carcharias]|uniref:E3 ubiquitin-protein ligase znrf2-like isoform X2 n=1 Tax=Carcharodon carcharias TaxID=13397 RepID=UPI001B7F243A|nr:E3 ubiquitin-protein ligase znrf2-like isoform X2 [Carcharodon carcharias]